MYFYPLFVKAILNPEIKQDTSIIKMAVLIPICPRAMQPGFYLCCNPAAINREPVAPSSRRTLPEAINWDRVCMEIVIISQIDPG